MFLTAAPSVLRPEFDGREFDGGQHVPVGLDERGPGRPPLTLGCGLDAVRFQDVADRRVRHVVTQIRERALNACVSPAGILPRQQQHEQLNLFR
jgi:hypothetical protein